MVYDYLVSYFDSTISAAFFALADVDVYCVIGNK
jgi:hypothetical protein